MTVIQLYAPTTNAKEAEADWFYEGLQDLLELTLKKDILFIIGDWNAKVGSQEIPGVTGTFDLEAWKEAWQRLTEFCQGDTPGGQCQSQIDYIVCSQRWWRSSIQSAKPRPGADWAQITRNLYPGQEATVRTGHGTDWFKIGKRVRQGCILSPYLFNFCAEYVKRNSRLDESKAGIKIAKRNTNNLRNADDTTLM